MPLEPVNEWGHLQHELIDKQKASKSLLKLEWIKEKRLFLSEVLKLVLEQFYSNEILKLKVAKILSIWNKFLYNVIKSIKYLTKTKLMWLQPKKIKYKKIQKGKLTKLNFRSNKPKRNFNTISNLFATKTAASFLSSSWGTFLIVGFAVVSVC